MKRDTDAERRRNRERANEVADDVDFGTYDAVANGDYP